MRIWVDECKILGGLASSETYSPTYEKYLYQAQKYIRK